MLRRCTNSFHAQICSSFRQQCGAIMCNPRLRPQNWHSLLESFWPVTWQRLLLWEVDWSEIYYNITVYNVNICKLYWNVLGVGKWHIVASIGILRSLTGHHDLDVLTVFLPRSFCHLQWLSFAPARKLFQSHDFGKSKNLKNIRTIVQRERVDAGGYNDKKSMFWRVKISQDE